MPKHGDIVTSLGEAKRGYLYLFIELGRNKAVVLDLNKGLSPNSDVLDLEVLQRAYRVFAPNEECNMKIEINR